MGTDGACSLLFCAAKRCYAFHPNLPAGLRARVSRLGGSRGRSPGNCFPINICIQLYVKDTGNALPEARRAMVLNKPPACRALR
jgi:hypothetical protein